MMICFSVSGFIFMGNLPTAYIEMVGFFPVTLKFHFFCLWAVYMPFFYLWRSRTKLFRYAIRIRCTHQKNLESRPLGKHSTLSVQYIKYRAEYIPRDGIIEFMGNGPDAENKIGSVDRIF